MRQAGRVGLPGRSYRQPTSLLTLHLSPSLPTHLFLLSSFRHGSESLHGPNPTPKLSHCTQDTPFPLTTGHPDRAKPPPGWSDQCGAELAIPFLFLEAPRGPGLPEVLRHPHPSADSCGACRRPGRCTMCHTCSCKTACPPASSGRCCSVLTISHGCFEVQQFDRHKLLVSAPGWQGPRGNKVCHTQNPL